MSTQLTTGTNQEVVLLRLGVGKSSIPWHPGLTLADLLREAQTGVEDREIFLDGKPLAESVILEPGTIVSVVSKGKNIRTESAWMEGIGDFRDDPAFEEMM